jgi:hypothetical protein
VIADAKEESQILVVSEQGAQENIWTYERRNNGTIEKVT